MSRRHAWADTAEELAPGLHRLPLPLHDNPLRAVNAYVVRSDDGVALVDTGWTGPTYYRELVERLRSVDVEIEEVQRVLVTHFHMDHVGQADRIRRATGAPFSLGEGERPAFDALILTPAQVFERRMRRLTRAGAAELVPALRGSKPELDLDWDPPDEYLTGGQTIDLGGRRLEVIPTPGHTQGHVCFHDRDARILLSGDHVLPRVTPSIGFEPRPTGTALADFLASLAQVRNLPVDTVLPAHGPVFGDLTGRVDALTRHHVDRLERSHAAVGDGGLTALEVARQLPWTSRAFRYESLDTFNRMLAVLETLAHLELLERRQVVARETVDGIWRFSPA